MQGRERKPSGTTTSLQEIAQQAIGHTSQHDGLVRRRRRAWKRWLTPLALISSDALLAALVWITASVLQGIFGRGALSVASTAAVVASVAVWIGIRWLMGLYPGYGLDAAERLRRHTYSVFIALAVVTIFATAFQVGGSLSRLLLALGFTGLLLLTPLAHGLARWRMWRLGLWGRPVVIISYADTSARTVKLLKEEWAMGYDPIAVFDRGLRSSGTRNQRASYEETMSQAEDLARVSGVDTIIFALPQTRREHLALLVRRASLSFRHVLIFPNLVGLTNSAVTARNLAGTLAVEVKYNLLNPWALRVKRVLDLGATVLGGTLVLPILLVIALFVYVESGRPVFYADWRIGRNGVLFPCVKFRTMVSGAEDVLRLMLAEDAGLREEYAKYHKLRVDPRVTRVGRFLRRTSLDELPQLWNVLRGEMSLVGPRPYLPRESDEIGEARSEILRVPPGVTGPWQVAGRNHASFDDRVLMDVYYVRDWSVWLDVVLLAGTVRAIFIDRRAY
jgi:Undecaprenyl-phosphate galactose phosphotransferase WbaP